MTDRPNASGGPAAPADAARHFRQVLGNYPTGVAIITASVDGEPVGMVVGSFTSVSLDPPLVAFFADNGSETWAVLAQSESFCVNVLSSSQEVLSRQFVRRGTDRYADVAWRAAPSGSPIIEGVVAWIDCDFESITQYGDHQMVVGRVRDLAVEDPATPLIFHRGGYGEFNPRALISVPERDLLEALKLVDLARPILDDLASGTGMECTVNAAIGDTSVLLARIAPGQRELLGSPVGYRVPLAPPLGTALMAWAPQEELDAWLARSPVPLHEEDRDRYLAMLAKLREDGWAWFTKDTGFTRVQAILNRAGMEGMPNEAVHGAVRAILQEPGFNSMPVPLEPGRRYEVNSIVAPVVLPDRETVLSVNLLGAEAESYSAEEIARAGERLRAAAQAVGQLRSGKGA